MKVKKKYVVLLIILAIYLVVYFTLFYKKDTKSDGKLKNYINLIIGEDADFLYHNNEWSVVNDADKISYNWLKYKIYDGNEYLGKYYLLYSGIWNLKDNKKNTVDINFSEKVAIGGDLKCENVKINSSYNDSKNSYIKKVLSDNLIDVNSTLTSNTTIKMDIDNDSVDEEFYVISNAFIDDENPEKIFSFVFYVDNDNINVIYKQIFSNTTLSNVCKPYISNIFKINNKYYFAVNCSRYSDLGRSIVLYKYRGNKFVKVISN